MDFNVTYEIYSEQEAEMEFGSWWGYRHQFDTIHLIAGHHNLNPFYSLQSLICFHELFFSGDFFTMQL